MALVGNISGSGGISNTIGITGSLIIANPGLALFPELPGTDTVFFVSGAIDGKTAGSRTVSVFGGDTVVSGSLTIGTGSIRIDSNEIRFLGGAAKITSSSAGLTFFDSNNTGGKSLTELAAGGGGGDSVFTVASSTEAYTTSSIAIGYGAAASSLASDLFFYVSGSTDGTKNALFGGDVVTSGSLTVRDGTGNLAITADGFGSSYLTAAGSYLNLDANNRVIVKKDLQIQGTNIYAGDSGYPRNIFPDNASQTNLITIGGVGGKTTVAGELEVTSNFISGSTGVNLTLGSSGDVTVAGDLTVTGNDIKSSTGATAITLSGGNVIIPGDLTVQGTTVTVDATTLTIEDPVVGFGFTSGSTAVTAGDRGFIGGINAADNVALFWDNTDSTFTAARTSTGAGNDPVAITSYTPFRASSFQVGGTPGSAVAADSAYISSSDALNVLVNHKSSTTFTKAGTAIVQIADFGGDGMITGNSAINTIASLWVSGSTVNMGHTLSASLGPVPHGIKIVGGGIEGGSLRITTAGGPALNINSHSGTNQAQSLIMSGSAVTINAATSNNTNGVLIQGAGGNLARIYGNANNGNVDFSASTATTISALATSSTAELTLTGSNINLGHGSEGGKAITLQRGGSKYGEILYAPDGGRTYAQFNSTNIGTNVRIGTSGAGPNAGNINLSGSLVEILSAGGAGFQTLGTTTTYLTVQSGSYVTPPATALNFAKIEAGPTSNLLIGSAGTTVVSGSSVRFNVAGPGTVAMQSHGTTFLTFASGSGTDNSVTIAPVNATTANLLNTVATTVNFAGAANAVNIGKLTGGAVVTISSVLTGSNPAFFGDTVTIGGPGSTTSLLTTNATANLFNTTATTVNFAGAATTLEIGAATGTTSVNNNLTVDGTTTLGNQTTDDITFTGYAASSLIPKTTNSFDLGTPDLRWRNMYTGDLHLKNERGDWTVIEEEDFLTLTNNKSGKRYKFVLEEI